MLTFLSSPLPPSNIGSIPIPCCRFLLFCSAAVTWRIFPWHRLYKYSVFLCFLLTILKKFFFHLLSYKRFLTPSFTYSFLRHICTLFLFAFSVSVCLFDTLLYTFSLVTNFLRFPIIVRSIFTLFSYMCFILLDPEMNNVCITCVCVCVCVCLYCR